MFKISRIGVKPEQSSDMDVFHKLAQQFLPYAHKNLGFDKPVSINLMSDPNNAKDPLGKTAYYDPSKMEVTLFIDKRHVKDILRSLSHELVHHTQNCRGDFDRNMDTSPGYAQNDEHMRKCEGEAYLHGSGFLFRDWEDSLKKENQTMKESKINQPTDEGLSDLSGDGKVTQKDVLIGKGVLDKDGNPTSKKEKVDEIDAQLDEEYDMLMQENDGEGMNEETVDESNCGKRDDKKDDTGGEGELEEIVAPEKSKAEKFVKHLVPPKKSKEEEEIEKFKKNENWTRGNKNQILFEKLTKKWTK